MGHKTIDGEKSTDQLITEKLAEVFLYGKPMSSSVYNSTLGDRFVESQGGREDGYIWNAKAFAEPPSVMALPGHTKPYGEMNYHRLSGYDTGMVTDEGINGPLSELAALGYQVKQETGRDSYPNKAQAILSGTQQAVNNLYGMGMTGKSEYLWQRYVAPNQYPNLTKGERSKIFNEAVWPHNIEGYTPNPYGHTNPYKNMKKIKPDRYDEFGL